MLEHLDLAKKNAEKNPESLERFKDKNIVDSIRKKYKTDSSELAILRKEIARLSEIVSELTGGEVNSEEFKAYNGYVEECKTAVKHEIGLESTTDAAEDPEATN